MKLAIEKNYGTEDELWIRGTDETWTEGYEFLIGRWDTPKMAERNAARTSAMYRSVFTEQINQAIASRANESLAGETDDLPQAVNVDLSLEDVATLTGTDEEGVSLYILRNWRKYDSKEETVTDDESGEEVVYSPELGEDLLLKDPGIYRDIQKASQEYSAYRDAWLSVLEGN